MLAVIEKQIHENGLAAALDDRESSYDPEPLEEFKTTVTSLNVTFQQIGALLRSIPTFKYDDINFVPLFPPEVHRAGRLLPTSELVYLTNLRSVVESLSYRLTPIAVRRNFISRNSIPGAIDVDLLLMNADEIILQNYRAKQLGTDLYGVKRWIKAATDENGARDKWFTSFKWGELDDRNESVLVSNEAEWRREEFISQAEKFLHELVQPQVAP
ncbi:hypothetical protein J6590_087014 [Homalodisca vitripennis]|nr:hypothetical protein J6590_087014 [Homalodisca vitripennis]